MVDIGLIWQAWWIDGDLWYYLAALFPNDAAKVQQDYEKQQGDLA